jgi:hypothetical protein
MARWSLLPPPDGTLDGLALLYAVSRVRRDVKS